MTDQINALRESIQHDVNRLASMKTVEEGGILDPSKEPPTSVAFVRVHTINPRGDIRVWTLIRKQRSWAWWGHQENHLSFGAWETALSCVWSNRAIVTCVEYFTADQTLEVD